MPKNPPLVHISLFLILKLFTLIIIQQPGWYIGGQKVLISAPELIETGKEEFGDDVHFHYWHVLRQILAFA